MNTTSGHRKVGKNKKEKQALDVICTQNARCTKRCQSGAKCLAPVRFERKAASSSKEGQAKCGQL